MRPRDDVHSLLINPPLTDPTQPYHSIPYLAGAAYAAGYANLRCVDANIEALDELARPAHLGPLLGRARRLRETLEQKPRLSRGEELLYRHALLATGFQADTVACAIDTLRDPERFYDYKSYRQAVTALGRWCRLLCVDGVPGAFDRFSLAPSGPANFACLDDLTNQTFLDRLVAPFAPYWDGPFARVLNERRWGLIGLSVSYWHQLPFAIWMLRRIRARCPDALLCVGGTEVSDVLKYLRDPSSIWRVFAACDAIVPGEGESALVALLDAARAGARPFAGMPGVLVPGDDQGPRSPPIQYEDLRTTPSPRHDVWDWGRYWSPEPVVLYSPTRGCYWNRCTFCDYGLNSDSPTSPSRERPIERALSELRSIAGFSRTVYFAVDAISPGYLRRLCNGLAAEKLALRWAAELRLERSFPQKRMGALLKSAGCVAISFGYESGSQRILDLIDKGVQLSEVPSVLNELSHSGIGCQMMGFIGFPGETEDEAIATYEFLCEHEDLWTLAGIGDFQLTPGSIVAKRPHVFGISDVHAREGDDIVRTLGWRDQDGRAFGSSPARSPRLQALADRVDLFADTRPFVGGIDTAHSLLYFARYGPRLTPPLTGAEGRNPLVPSVRTSTPFPDFESFISCAELAALHGSGDRAPGRREFVDWLAQPGAASERSEDGRLIEIYPSGAIMACDGGQDGSAVDDVKKLLLDLQGLA